MEENVLFFNSEKSIYLLLIVVILICLTPISFAQENITDNIKSPIQEDVIAADYYFDASLENDTGDGSAQNPYKELTDERLMDNSVIHLAEGEYNFQMKNHKSNVVFQGISPEKTVINGKGTPLLIEKSFSMSNITFVNIPIFNQGQMNAVNCVFKNSEAAYLNSHPSTGGAIYTVSHEHSTYLNNCTFINNSAYYGGAIYVNGGYLEAINCHFINNTALSYGGAIACENQDTSKSRAKIINSTFNGDKSINNAGGAIFIFNSQLDAKNVNIFNSNAMMGSAITLINSISTLNNLLLVNNSAENEGGAIYSIYGDLSIIQSIFYNNTAKYGSALFIDASNQLTLKNNLFENNKASFLATVYLLSNNKTDINLNTYENNSALKFNDSYSTNYLNVFISNNNYTLFVNNANFTGQLPGYYNSPYITSVKNQFNGGNCWAFSTLAVLEAAILKASGLELDLSENNMKNLMAQYSLYGWNMGVNEGGYDEMGITYLTSWLGPILETQDQYDDSNSFSSVLNALTHVQNIIFLKRDSFTDNDEIKRAIINYGAVNTGIYMVPNYNSAIKKYVQYYGGALDSNHAVAIVGWDDDFVVNGAPGKGAWICKNSWGSNWGGGYFYVSYYDKTCARVGENGACFAIIFNETVKYDKNYQYDLPGITDYFFKASKNTVWYKNIFTATENEYLAAASTYFEKDTFYDLFVYVNNELKSFKSGFSKAGYWTFDLGEFVQLNEGDIFEIVFKISVNGDAGVPISEKISLNNYFYKEGISFISYDGKKWDDLFNLEGDYPDHIYTSQVACIKAFTIIDPVNTTIDLKVVNRTFDVCVVQADVFNQYGFALNSGNVIFSLGDEKFTVPVKNGVARFSIDLNSISRINLTAEFKAEGFVSSMFVCEVLNPLINTTTQLILSNSPYNPINISAIVLDFDGNPVRYGSVIFNLSGEFYTVRVINGTANLTNFNLTPGENIVSAFFSDYFYYNSSNDTCNADILIKNTQLELNITTDNAVNNNPVNITAYILDEDGCPVNSGAVIFNISGEEITVEVADGMAKVNYIFTKMGINNISALYTDKYFYNSSYANDTVDVSKIRVNMIFNQIFDYQNDQMVIGVSILNCIKAFEISYYENGIFIKKYQSNDNGDLTIYRTLDYGNYSYRIVLDSQVYEADDLNGSFNVPIRQTQIVDCKLNVCTNGEYYVILKDKQGNSVSNVEITLEIHSKTFKVKTDDEGKAIFNINFYPGDYSATFRFGGDDLYYKSSLMTKIHIESSIILSNTVYAQNSDCSIKFFSKQNVALSNADVKIVFNGKTYSVKTNSNGVASFNINIKPGTYLLKLTNPDTGEVLNQYIDVVKRISKNSGLTMYYGAGKTYSVKVVDDNGKIAKRVKVKFTINGRTYTKTTDDKGVASLKISQNPGTYTITAMYKNVKVTNKIIVKSTIVTKDIKVKKGKTIKFNVKLLDKNGKILKNKKLKIKFKGKTYKVKTNRKGIATLKINKNYKKGTYTVLTSYGKLIIKNKVIIR